ncbi:MAG: hypothetical protein ACUBOA_11835 [Candidatus Loosdrechtia sp.]|uniref:hypothetical protein n=1 Tax=Candidatus Loosdrechtia sp. TaxID=3101272 RepID=UPI003A710490|nr:MAG: tetratricopeptide repeat protein [Candidatus Jettenia sp. AMX2]
MIARLENDHNREQEKLIIDDISEFKGIEVLPLDRVIKLAGPVPEEMEKRGHETALRYLKQSGGDVLIWGKIIRLQDKTVPKLYWTHVFSGEEVQFERYTSPRHEEFLRLPGVFREDLSKILQLLIATGKTRFDALEGHYVADQLKPFINRVRTLLEKSARRPGWDAKARGATLISLGGALRVLGEQGGRNESLVEAVAMYHEALKEYTRERAPLQWAATQNNLGIALRKLGERETGTERLEDAVAAFQEALKERTQERVPLNWATTQNNRGGALLRLGEREPGTERLEEAVAAFREALKVFEKVPHLFTT